MPEPATRDRIKLALLACALAGLAGGIAVWLTDLPDMARLVWSVGTMPVLAALGVEIVLSLRRGEVGLDIVAALSMTAALIFGEALAANVVALMYSGGTFLESFAEGRARAEMHALLSRVPRSVLRHRNGGLEDTDLDAVEPGDLLLIRHGDVVPVDGTAEAQAVLDQSALTGEAMPARLTPGASVMSGAVNAGEAFDLRATARAEESTYAGIVRLVEAAQRSKAPMSRLADRYSLGFLAVTVAIAGAAWWLTGDPIRAVAVLVVATPCPLILAVPVALVAGLSRAARFGVLIKGAGALGNAGADPDPDPRQDRDIDRWAATNRLYYSGKRVFRGGCAAACRLGRPGVKAPDRAGHCCRGDRARPGAERAGGRARTPRRRGRGADRRASGDRGRC